MKGWSPHANFLPIEIIMTFCLAQPCLMDVKQIPTKTSHKLKTAHSALIRKTTKGAMAGFSHRLVGWIEQRTDRPFDSRSKLGEAGLVRRSASSMPPHYQWCSGGGQCEASRMLYHLLVLASACELRLMKSNLPARSRRLEERDRQAT